ncbi:family 43 glycosylhydrolase [Paludisphaera rhizosphaerae]|nr:family 43 glycosylhydrolase [Paludisphaera rhizosphaerae]
MTTRRLIVALTFVAAAGRAFAEDGKAPAPGSPIVFSDDSRLGKPYAKDPSVVKFRGAYWMYYSLPGMKAGPQGFALGWSIGVAKSDDLKSWKKVGEILPEQEVERNGICAPGARVVGDRLHLFYQTYGNGARDAICHAVSEDGVHFDRDKSNPVFHPTGAWSVGRAIDAELFEWKGKYFLYYATRDPEMKIQMLGVATSAGPDSFGSGGWTDLSVDGPLLKPELPWEGKCIEAASLCTRDGKVFMFYAGAFNNAPQQIGVAVSDDAVHFQRLSDKPFLPNGPPGSWNSSESGHPGVFVDDDGSTYLFYQGNDTKGKTWSLARLRVEWKDGKPVPAAE